jgi:hypothetical protein
MREGGYNNTPWDPKFLNGSRANLSSSSVTVMISDGSVRLNTYPNGTTSSQHSTVTNATEKEFVGIRITREEDVNYYMDQSRMIDAIVKEANIDGAPGAKLPYPLDGPALSDADCATEHKKAVCSRYPKSQDSWSTNVRHGTHHGHHYVRSQLYSPDIEIIPAHDA